MNISIVIPAYNEAENVEKTVTDISNFMKASGMEYEIILVNDGSRDRTGEIVRALTVSIPHLILVENMPNRGYGGALKAGFAAATKEVIVFVPADGQFVFSELPRLLEKLTPDITLVSGIRADRKDATIRKVNGYLWNMLVRVLFGKLITDIDCGFKVFRREVLNHISLESNGALIDTEMLGGMKREGYRFAEVSVTHLPRLAGTPTGANLKVIVKALYGLIKLRISLWNR